VAPIYALCRFIIHAFKIGDDPGQVNNGPITPAMKRRRAMLTIRRITASLIVMTSLALAVQMASAHPSSGIVVDHQGQVFFQDIVAGAIWKIDTQGNLTKFYDKLGGHWMALVLCHVLILG
jgi:hypothetical protein